MKENDRGFHLLSRQLIDREIKRGIMMKQTEQKEIGRIRLTDARELVASLIDDEKLDLRIWVDSESYKGWTKQGLRFYLHEGNWDDFKKLIDKVDRAYQEIA